MARCDGNRAATSAVQKSSRDFMFLHTGTVMRAVRLAEAAHPNAHGPDCGYGRARREVRGRRLHWSMQLHVARLCMDCEEVHDAQTCPVCGSETFAFISRWIPTPERRQRPRTPEPAEAVDTYRELLSPTAPRSGAARWLRRGAVGLAAATAVGWAWQRRSRPSSPAENAGSADERDAGPKARS